MERGDSDSPLHLRWRGAGGEARPQSDAEPLSWPSVSVIVVTHNGRAHLERCLPALAALDYPRDRYRVVVVDNASTDGTASFVARAFPDVLLVRSERNLGFAAGNNLGIARAPADFYVTLNDDTEVTPGWLEALLRPARSDPAVGLCTGKLILMEDRLSVEVRSFVLPPLLPSEGEGEFRVAQPAVLPLSRALGEGVGGEGIPAFLDGRPTRALILNGVEALAEALKGASAKASTPFRTGPPWLTVGIPVSPGDRPVTLQVGPGWPVGTTVEACFGDGPPTIAVVSADGRLTLPIPSDAPIRPVVQNAGSLVFRDGRGRDRGAVARPGSHFFADDVGQFDQVEEVFAGCGASLLLRATTLADVGGFDERFFMYYEDTDLSWRARLGGWKVIYAPDALVRHRHRGSSAAWSGRFVYYTERNRLFMLLKLAPLDRALVQLGRAFLAAGRASLAAVRRAARGQNPAAAYAGPRWAALASLAVQLPGLLRSRAQIQTQRRVKQSEIDRWLT